MAFMEIKEGTLECRQNVKLECRHCRHCRQNSKFQCRHVGKIVGKFVGSKYLYLYTFKAICLQCLQKYIEIIIINYTLIKGLNSLKIISIIRARENVDIVDKKGKKDYEQKWTRPIIT